MVWQCAEFNCEELFEKVSCYREHIKKEHIKTFSLDATEHQFSSWKGK